MRNLFLSLMMLCGMMLQAVTILKPGDVAFVQVNYATNSFDFVPLVNLETGTKIMFTDYSYSAKDHKLVNRLEGKVTGYELIATYTVTDPVAAGTVIQSKGNAAFNSSSFNFMNWGSIYKGETLIAFQVNGLDTSYLAALGWMSANNFVSNLDAGTSDIPPGLSFADYTVVQLDSVMTPGIHSAMAKNFKYSTYNGLEGTAKSIRRLLSTTSNFYTYDESNTIVEGPFKILPPDNSSPVLLKSVPAQNKIDVSVTGGVDLVFNEPVVRKKIITVRELPSDATTYIGDNEMTISGSSVSIPLAFMLKNSKNYRIEIPQGAFTDLDGNPWPVINDTVFSFATSAKRSNIPLNFWNGTGATMRWTTLNVIVGTWDTYLNGYWSFTVNGLPMRWYKTEWVESADKMPVADPSARLYVYNPEVNSRLVVDLSAMTNTVTALTGEIYDNGCNIVTQVYSGGHVVASKTIERSNFSPYSHNEQMYSKLFLANENLVKLDSVVIGSAEGAIFSLNFEIIDIAAPTVELGSAKILCEGDSVKLDAGFTPGAVYSWNTGATSQSIFAKTTGTYSVTVKNTLGEATDHVIVTVSNSFTTLLHGDTIKACLGDTVLLNAGDAALNYLWLGDGLDQVSSNTKKVTQTGWYKVGVTNGGCWKMDSAYVEFAWSRLNIYAYQGGMWGFSDCDGILYKKNSAGKFVPFITRTMSGNMIMLDTIPAGEYIFKAHFTKFTFIGSNPFQDTYHDGNTEWAKVTPFRLTCNIDSSIGFLMKGAPMSFDFNGSAAISGKIQLKPALKSVAMHAGSTQINVVTDCDTKILLYSNGDLIATTCPDATGFFEFANLPAGNYTVSVERTGFGVSQPYQVSVVAGQSVSNNDFVIDPVTFMVEPAVITSVLKTESGEVSVYPNPAVDRIWVALNSAFDGPANVEIVDALGRVLFAAKMDANGRTSFDVQGLQGLYVVKVSSLDQTLIRKLLVK